jgi:uncharacterized protein YneF (UPF0154 family)
MIGMYMIIAGVVLLGIAIGAWINEREIKKEESKYGNS